MLDARLDLDAASATALLARLGLSAAPAVSKEGLDLLYRAWCRKVPFDNLLRRIRLAGAQGGAAAPLPGFDPAEFIGAFLEHGAGGTCTPSGGALAAVLRWVGFDACQVLARMDEPGRCPGAANHTAVLVRLDGLVYLVDVSIRCERAIPLRLGPGVPTVLADPLHPVAVRRVVGLAGGSRGDGRSTAAGWCARSPARAAPRAPPSCWASTRAPGAGVRSTRCCTPS